jgi:hypothetical protein
MYGAGSKHNIVQYSYRWFSVLWKKKNVSWEGGRGARYPTYKTEQHHHTILVHGIWLGKIHNNSDGLIKTPQLVMGREGQ